MKVFLHIGDARTGTTSLQWLLMRNRKRLLQLGLDYPRVGLLNANTGVAQHKLAFSLLDTWPAFALGAKTGREDAWAELRSHMDTATLPIFLSSEAFSSLQDGVGFVAEFFRGHDVQVLYVRRDPEEWRASIRQQHILSGKRPSQATNRPALDHSKRKIAAWSAHFPVQVIAYGTACHAQLLRIVGIDMEKLEPVERKNTKLPEDVLDLIIALNKIPMEERHRFRFNSLITQWFADHR